MRTILCSSVLLAAALGLAACGGGSGYSAPAPVVAATTPTPTTAPSPTTGTTTLATMTLLGSSGFVAPNGFTAYILSNDTTTSLACTVASGCTGVWPVIAPPTGIALSTGFTVYTRADNGAAQLAYNGHPLYTYAGDSGAAQTNGQGIVSFGGTWSVARP
jgi:predicted lipoprotein with Yx(FWY)xxD motif